MTGRCCQRKCPEACPLSGSPRVAIPCWAMVVLPCSAAVASLATSSKCRRPPALVFLLPATLPPPPSGPLSHPRPRHPWRIYPHLTIFFVLAGRARALTWPSWGSTREALCQTHHKKAPPVLPPAEYIRHEQPVIIIHFPPASIYQSHRYFAFLAQKTPVLLPELRHPHNRGFGQDSSCHSRFLRLDTAYSVSGPAITTLRAAGGRVAAGSESEHTIPRAPRGRRTRVGFSKPRETFRRFVAPLGWVALPPLSPSRSAWVPRGKEPCPTKSHPKSPRLARRTRGSLVFFFQGTDTTSRLPSPCTRAPKQREKTTFPDAFQSTPEHTWFLFAIEPCSSRTNGCLLYAASHPPSTAGPCSAPSATLSTFERGSPAASQPGPGPAAAAAAFGRVLIPSAEPGQQLARPRDTVLRAPQPV